VKDPVAASAGRRESSLARSAAATGSATMRTITSFSPSPEIAAPATNGADFHDLATFHWDTGEKERALQVAETGLKKGAGRMDELRSFLSERARESGDRGVFLNLGFQQTTDSLTLGRFKAFEKVCEPEEWTRFAPLLLEHLDKARESDKLEIFMYRKDYEQALTTLKRRGPPGRRYDGGYLLEIAQKLEGRFPKDAPAEFYVEKESLSKRGMGPEELIEDMELIDHHEVSRLVAAKRVPLLF